MRGWAKVPNCNRCMTLLKISINSRSVDVQIRLLSEVVCVHVDSIGVNRGGWDDASPSKNLRWVIAILLQYPPIAENSMHLIRGVRTLYTSQ